MLRLSTRAPRGKVDMKIAHASRSRDVDVRRYRPTHSIQEYRIVSLTRSSEAPESVCTAPDDDIAREPIRGSSLLLVGKLLSLALMCAVQILVTRHLSRSDYGAWTYALSVVTLLQSVAALGLDRSVTRFLAIYREHGDLARVRGLVLLLVGVVAGFGTLVTIILVSFPTAIASVTGVDTHVLALLNIIIFLVPLEALDLLFIGLFACLGQARAIVVRRHILSPSLKLAAVVVLVSLNADVTFLAYGYLAASLAGMLLYGPMVTAVGPTTGVSGVWLPKARGHRARERGIRLYAAVADS